MWVRAIRYDAIRIYRQVPLTTRYLATDSNSCWSFSDWLANPYIFLFAVPLAIRNNLICDPAVVLSADTRSRDCYIRKDLAADRINDVLESDDRRRRRCRCDKAQLAIAGRCCLPPVVVLVVFGICFRKLFSVRTFHPEWQRHELSKRTRARYRCRWQRYRLIDLLDFLIFDVYRTCRPQAYMSEMIPHVARLSALFQLRHRTCPHRSQCDLRNLLETSATTAIVIIIHIGITRRVDKIKSLPFVPFKIRYI